MADLRDVIQYTTPVDAPLAQAPAAGMPPAEIPPRRSWRWVWLAASCLVVLGLAGGGYFAYSRGYISIPYISPKGDQLFDRMVNSISDIKTAQYGIRLNVEAQPRSAGAQPLIVNTNSSANSNSNSSVMTGLRSTGLIPGLGYGSTDIFQAIPADAKIDGGMTLYLEAGKKVADSNGLFKLDGTYSGGDSSIALDLEFRKSSNDIYGIVRKFPSFFLLDLSAVKNKWVVLTQEDADSSTLDAIKDIDTRQGIDAFKAGLKLALEAKVLSIDRKLPTETIAGVRSDHYLIAIKVDQLPDFVQRLTDQRKKDGKDTKDLESLLTEINKPEVADQIKRVVDNSKIEIWIDKVSGMLRQIRWGLTAVPPENNERLKGKQFQISLQLTLDKVNDAVKIDKPDPTIDLDEATRLVTGVSKEQQQLEKQTNQVSQVRSALKQYLSLNKAYPDSLDQLNSGLKQASVECGKTTSNSNSPPTNSSYECYTTNLYKDGVKITDVYTGKTYGYTKEADNYKLTYQIQLAGDIDSYTKDEYAEGQNTATKSDVSVEKKSPYEERASTIPSASTNTNTSQPSTSATDSDYDGLSDVNEALYGTNPNLLDTDGDGYNDGQEVTGGYNPKGSGRAIPPKIKQVMAQTTSTGMTVTWDTDVPATGYLVYGTKPGEKMTEIRSVATDDRKIKLTAPIPLSTSQTITYNVTACVYYASDICTTSMAEEFKFTPLQGT